MCQQRPQGCRCWESSSGGWTHTASLSPRGPGDLQGWALRHRASQIMQQGGQSLRPSRPQAASGQGQCCCPGAPDQGGSPRSRSGATAQLEGTKLRKARAGTRPAPPGWLPAPQSAAREGSRAGGFVAPPPSTSAGRKPSSGLHSHCHRGPAAHPPLRTQAFGP